MWHRLLGHRVEHVVESARAGAGEKSRGRLGGNRQGTKLGAKSQRERDYIDALAVIYVDHDKLGHLPRTQAYAKAMEKVAQSYPKDDEAQIHYALALDTRLRRRQDLRQPAQRRGDPGADLARQPHHPGVAHYLIHTYRRSPRRDERGEGLREDRAGRSACAAHAVAYLHARRLLGRVDRTQQGRAACC